MDIHDHPTQAGVPWHEDITMQQPGQSGAMPAIPATVQSRRGLSRRALFAGAAAGIGAVTVGGVAFAEWMQNKQTGPIASDVQIGHLLRRAGFGTTANEMTMYRNLSFAGAVDRLVNYQQVSDDDLENRLNTLRLPSNNLTKIADVQRWWLLRMAWTQRPLLEKMTLFWHGVLTSSYRKAGGKKNYINMKTQNDFLRTHAFDTYDNLLLGITSDPAMLYYLDLGKSTKNAPNENYARELMELFTLGIGNYTQQDVYQGAAALTGWHFAGGGTSSRYVPQLHNDMQKTYLGQTGKLDYKDVVRILASHPATPWFISHKLFTFFVYENPSNDDLKPLVDTYINSGHNMGAVMKTLLLSPQFSSAKAYRMRIKSPVEYVVGAYRALEIGGNGVGLSGITTVTGQTLLDPPNVAGWPGDKVSALWLNSGTWMSRLNYIDVLLTRGDVNGKTGNPSYLQNVVNANRIDSPEHFIDYYAAFLLDGNLDAMRKTQLLDYFNAPGTSRGGAHITLTNGKSYPLGNVRGTLYLMMTAPEYHLN